MHQQTKENTHVSKDQKLCCRRGRRRTRHRGLLDQLRVGAYGVHHIIECGLTDQLGAIDKWLGRQHIYPVSAVVVGGDDIGASHQCPYQHRTHVERAGNERTDLE
jgi:hypothetical protein